MNKFGIVVAGSLLSLGAFAQDGVTLGGYVDAGYTAMMVDKVEGTEVSDTSGFLVREAAVYLGKKWGTEWEVFSDFSYSSNGSTFTDSAGDTVDTDPTFGIAQAFVAQTMENGFGWKIGKFDTVFGYYAGRGDSHAHRLTDTGYIQRAYLPSSHLGWIGSYSFSDMLKVSAMVANNDESFGISSNGTTSTDGTGHPDFGVLVNADFDAFSADLGAYIMSGESASPTTGDNELGYVVSAVVEGNFNPLTFGVYGVYFKNDVEDNAAGKNAGDFGIGGTVAYDVNEQFGADLRVEYVATSDKTSFFNPLTGSWQALTNATEVTSIMAGTIGGHYKFNDNVKAKLDYTLAQVDTDGTNADVDPLHIVQAGVVANF